MYVIAIYNAKEDLLPDVYEDKEGKVVMFVSELEAKLNSKEKEIMTV